MKEDGKARIGGLTRNHVGDVTQYFSSSVIAIDVNEGRQASLVNFHELWNLTVINYIIDGVLFSFSFLAIQCASLDCPFPLRFSDSIPCFERGVFKLQTHPFYECV